MSFLWATIVGLPSWLLIRLAAAGIAHAQAFAAWGEPV